MFLIKSSFSYWTASVNIDIFAQYFLKFSGNFSDHKIVMFGSGAVPKLINVCKYLYDVFVTNDLLSSIPPIDSVTQVGSPANNSLYSGVLNWRAILSLIINWSISSWASSSVKIPSLISFSIYISRNVDVLPKLIAAPLFSFIAAKYPKYNHCIASFALVAGLDISKPYLLAIFCIFFKARICSDTSSLNLIDSSETISILSKSFCFSCINLSIPYKAIRL